MKRFLISCCVLFGIVMMSIPFASAGIIQYCGEIGNRLGVATSCKSSCSTDEADVATFKSFVPAEYQFIMDSLCDTGQFCCATKSDTLCSKATTMIGLSGGSCSSGCPSGLQDVSAVKSGAPSLCTGGQSCCVQSGQSAQPVQANQTGLGNLNKGITTSKVSSAPSSPGYGLINPLGSRSVPTLVSDFIKWISGMAGSLCIIYLLWGGLEWMTAGGDPKKTVAARNRMLYAILGVVVIFFAYFLVDAIIGITNIPF